MEKISCTICVKNEVLQRVENEMNALQYTGGRLTGSVTSCVRSCLKQVNEGKILGRLGVGR